MISFKAKILMNEWLEKNKQFSNCVITAEDYLEAAQEIINRLAEDIAGYALGVIRRSHGPVLNIECKVGKSRDLTKALAGAFYKSGFAASFYQRGEDYILIISLKDG